MKYQEFRLIKIVIVVVLAIIVSSAVTTGNLVAPIAAFIAAALAIFLLKAKVKDVLSDERIEKVGGSAARLTLTITAIAMAATSFVFIALKQQYPQLLPAGYAMSYSACGMLLLYSILFKYKYAKGE